MLASVFYFQVIQNYNLNYVKAVHLVQGNLSA